MYTIRRAAFLLAVLCGAAFGVSLLWTPAPPAPFRGIDPGEVPLRLGEWHSVGAYALPADVQTALASAGIVSRLYRDGNSAHSLVDFVLIGGTDRDALHDPRSCLVGGGWRLENDRAETLAAPAITVRSCQAIRDSTSGEPGAFDMVYWYAVDGSVRSSATEIRTEMLASALLGRKNRPVYFFRLMMPLSADPSLRAADHRRLCALGAEAWKTLAPRVVAPR